MLKSIYAYWSVFSLRFVDNLHQRIKYNMLFRLTDVLIAKIGSHYIPSGGSEFSDRVSRWFDEAPQQAQLRQKYTAELLKITECQEIIASVQAH